MAILKVISSNIRFSNPNDGRNDWPFRKPLLAKLINEFKSDILATQEGRQEQILELEDSLTDLQIIDSHRKWIKERMYPCLFINNKVHNVLNSGDIWLSKTPYIAGSSSFNSAFPRLCTWAELQHIETKRNFFVINTHLDHLDKATRLDQTKVLINEIMIQNTKNLPLILCGDYNESPEGAVRHELTDCLKLTDPWIEISKAEESSHHKFSGDLKSGKRIDWILHSKGSFTTLDIHLDKTKEKHLYPSDHFILKAQYTY